MPYTIYQAGPLFSQAEKAFHRKISAALKAAGDIVVWPGDLIPDDRIAAAGSAPAPLVFTTCKQALDHCTCVVALLDGSQVDDGTAWEMGYAHARGLPIYGISTDARMAGGAGRSRMNAMIAGCLSGLAGNIGELVKLIHEVPQADKAVDEAIKRGW
jgi:nucleoside 2-deoxyribosyltransferase